MRATVAASAPSASQCGARPAVRAGRRGVRAFQRHEAVCEISCAGGAGFASCAIVWAYGAAIGPRVTLVRGAAASAAAIIFSASAAEVLSTWTLLVQLWLKNPHVSEPPPPLLWFSSKLSKPQHAKQLSLQWGLWHLHLRHFAFTLQKVRSS